MPLPTCPPGEVTRHAYDAKRKGSNKPYHVKSACIEDVGKPGKTPKSQRIPLLSKEDVHLGDYGYETKYAAKVRQAALHKAIDDIAAKKNLTKREAAVKVLRKLNALSILNKNTNPYDSEHKYKPDVEYLSKVVQKL